jgi:hypothetical protein
VPQFSDVSLACFTGNVVCFRVYKGAPKVLNSVINGTAPEDFIHWTKSAAGLISVSHSRTERRLL